jgi:hypothetical protein
MTDGLVIVIGGVAGVSLLVAVAVWWWLNRTPRIDRPADEVLPLFGSDLEVTVNEPGVRRAAAPPGSSAPPPVRPSHASESPAPPSYTPRPPTVPPAPPMPEPQRRPVVREFVTRTPPGAGVVPPPPAAPPASAPAGARAPAAPPATGAAVSADGVPGTMVEGDRLRFSVPADGTLQFLPGRLEVAAGRDAGREIRFVRLAGPDGYVVTFGRSEGPLYRHVQLREQTVSRRHARLRFTDGVWHLTNHSATNPVLLNGGILGDGEERSLQDGDRIEMGEVIFTFRSR